MRACVSREGVAERTTHALSSGAAMQALGGGRMCALKPNRLCAAKIRVILGGRGVVNSTTKRDADNGASGLHILNIHTHLQQAPHNRQHNVHL